MIAVKGEWQELPWFVHRHHQAQGRQQQLTTHTPSLLAPGHPCTMSETLYIQILYVCVHPTHTYLDWGGGGRDHYDDGDNDDGGHHVVHIYIHFAWNQTVVAKRMLVTERSSPQAARGMTLL